MTISTYSELKTAIANWLNRTDLTSRDAEFIAMFEAKFAREVKSRSMMQRNAAYTVSSEYTALPTGFLQMVTFKLTGSTIYSLQPVTNQWIDENFRDGSSGIPKFFTVIGSNVRVAPPPDSTYTGEIVYHSFTGLSDNATTNWLLTSHPDLYLFGSLCEAEPYLGNDERFPLWKSRRDEEMASVVRAEKRAQWGGGIMRVRADAVA